MGIIFLAVFFEYVYCNMSFEKIQAIKNPIWSQNSRNNGDQILIRILHRLLNRRHHLQM